MQFKEFLNASPPVWKTKKKPRKNRKKFMSKLVSSKEEDLDALADEMKEKGYQFNRRKSDSVHKWLLERIEKVKQCLRLLSEEEQCNLKPLKKWKSGDRGC